MLQLWTCSLHAAFPMKWEKGFFPGLSFSCQRTEFVVLAEDLLHWWGVCAAVFHQLGCYQTCIITEKFPALFFFTSPAPENHYPVVLALSTLYGRDSSCLGFAQSSSLATKQNSFSSRSDFTFIPFWFKKPKAICLYSLSQQETLAQDII